MTSIEKLMDAKVEGLYELVNTRFDNAASKLEELIKNQKITNGRVTKLELNSEINTIEHKKLTETLAAISETFKKTTDKIVKTDIKQGNILIHEKLLADRLMVIENALHLAREKGIHFWLWFSESKKRLIIFFLLFLAISIPELREFLINIVLRFIGKI